MRKIVEEMFKKDINLLEKEINDLRKEIARLKVESKISPQKDTNLLKKKRKKMAIMLTVLSQRKIGLK